MDDRKPPGAEIGDEGQLREEQPSSACVLVIEDDPANALLIQTVLINGGLDAVATESGDDILARVRSGSVAAVVMDVSLRDTVVGGRKVDGLELTRILRRESPRTIGVLLLTAHAMKGDRERFLEISTADRYMAKPIIDPDELVTTVRELGDFDIATRRSASQGPMGDP